MFQEFNAHVVPETYAIVGNDALIKCEVPSFVVDLVKVANWVDDSEQDFLAMVDLPAQSFVAGEAGKFFLLKPS